MKLEAPPDSPYPGQKMPTSYIWVNLKTSSKGHKGINTGPAEDGKEQHQASYTLHWGQCIG